MVASPARGQLNRDFLFIFFRPRSCLRNWSRETGSAVPSRVSPIILHTQAARFMIRGVNAFLPFLLGLLPPVAQIPGYNATRRVGNTPLRQRWEGCGRSWIRSPRVTSLAARYTKSSAGSSNTPCERVGDTSSPCLRSVVSSVVVLGRFESTVQWRALVLCTSQNG